MRLKLGQQDDLSMVLSIEPGAPKAEKSQVHPDL